MCTLNVRAPECVFPSARFVHYSYPSDLWAVACNAFYLSTNTPLFRLGHKATSFDLSQVMLEILGPVPGELVMTHNWCVMSHINVLGSVESIKFVDDNIPINTWLKDCLSYAPTSRPSLESFAIRCLTNTAASSSNRC